MQPSPKSNNEIEIFEELLRNHFPSFLRQVFYTVRPGKEYKHAWFLDLISEYLLAMQNGEIKNLIINLPPRCLKSIACSVAWPAWLLGHDPSKEILAVSYAQKLATKHSIDCRKVIESGWYRRIFPQTQIAHDQNEKTLFKTTQSGQRLAVSVGGFATGDGGDVQIIDDPMNPEEARSKTQRETSNEWIDGTLDSRVNDATTALRLLVMQRLEEYDTTGHIMENQEGIWTVLKLPAEFTARSFIHFGSVKKVIKPGELLHPERLPKYILERKKNAMGTRNYSAQFMQEPVPEGGSMIDLRWFDERYGVPPAKFPQLVISADTGIKSSEDNDYTAIGVFGVTDFGYYLLKVYRERWEYPDLMRNMISIAEDWKPTAILIEDKASGQQLLQDLRRNSRLPVIGIMPHGDKMVRMAGVTPLMEARRLFLPSSAPWLPDYEAEIARFPNATNDDQADMTSQFLKWINDRTGTNNSVQLRKL